MEEERRRGGEEGRKGEMGRRHGEEGIKKKKKRFLVFVAPRRPLKLWNPAMFQHAAAPVAKKKRSERGSP